ncbi:MAG: serine protease [Lachnospiraceae bacterium]|nr:serine protease [Lachnospiraceae bacterium]
MRYHRLPAIVIGILLIIMTPLHTSAKEAQTPHLIQTVTEQDIFEGMLSLGLLECSVLETNDCEAAYENVKDCIVQLHMRSAYGSGVIWEVTPEQIIIVTNKHVLDYWEDEISYVQFPQGYFTGAEILAVSGEYDIGFLAVRCTEFDYRELEQIRYVHHDAELYQTLHSGDDMFCVGAADVGENTENTSEHSLNLRDQAVIFFQGSIADTWRYIEEFEEYMLYCYGHAREGMSGGGTFDGKGNLIGIISGATMTGETASVPLPLIIEAYEEIR